MNMTIASVIPVLFYSRRRLSNVCGMLGVDRLCAFFTSITEANLAFYTDAHLFALLQES